MKTPELIALAELHGYGANAARILAGMSNTMFAELLLHETAIDANDGKPMVLFAGARTRAALLSRELVKHHRSDTDQTTRRYTITDLGYRILGLNELRKRTLAAQTTPAPQLDKLNATQEDTLRYFAGVKETGRGGKPKETTYAKLRELRLIARCDEFPYHRATEHGRAWLDANGATPNHAAWRALQSSIDTEVLHRRLGAAADATNAALGKDTGTYLNRGEEWYGRALTAYNAAELAAMNASCVDEFLNYP